MVLGEDVEGSHQKKKSSFWSPNWFSQLQMPLRTGGEKNYQLGSHNRHLSA